MVSKNFFSALDDSEDEGDTLKGFVDVKKEVINVLLNESNLDRGKKISNSEGILMNERRRPNNNARNIKAGRGQSSQIREGRRYYDRRSGTGRGREVRKGGSGPHNWGSDKCEARRAEDYPSGLQDNDEKVNSIDASTDEAADVNSKIVDNGTEVKETATRIEETEKEEKTTMTLEEFLKSKTDPESELFKPKETKAVDNEFIGKFAKVTPKEDVLMMGKGKTIRKKTNKKLEKTAVDIGFFSVKSLNSNRRNGERDRRGVNRGGYDHRDRKSGVSLVPKGTLNSMDTMAFPSL